LRRLESVFIMEKQKVKRYRTRRLMRFLKRSIQIFVALFFPWLIILMDDNLAGALLALVMQGTVIGWIPASIWALRVVRGEKEITPSQDEF